MSEGTFSHVSDDLFTVVLQRPRGAGKGISVSEYAFLRVICRDENNAPPFRSER